MTFRAKEISSDSGPIWGFRCLGEIMHSWQSFPKRRQYPSLPTCVGSALSLSVLKTDVITSQRPYSLKYDWFLSGCWCPVSLPQWALVVITRRFSFSREMPLPNSNPWPLAQRIPPFAPWGPPQPGTGCLGGTKGCPPCASSRGQLCNAMCSPEPPGESRMKPASSRDHILTCLPSCYPPPSRFSGSPSPETNPPGNHLHEDPHLTLYLYGTWPKTVNNTVFSLYYYY